VLRRGKLWPGLWFERSWWSLMIYFFVSLVQVLAKLCGCWMDRGEYTIQTSLTAFLGSSF
jgi:hypothetical protein